MMKSKEFPELKAWLEKKQGKFVTHDVQNEILTIMSNSVLRSLLKKIEGKIYSTMCDEYTDCSNHEQLTFCLHWVETLKAHETFLGFYEMPAPLVLLNNPGCREKEKHHNIQYCITSMVIKAQHRFTIHLQLKIDTVKVTLKL